MSAKVRLCDWKGEGLSINVRLCSCGCKYNFVFLSLVIDCGPLKAPANGDVKVAGTTFGFTAQYICNNGFVLNGFSSRVCQVTGKWLGDDPLCTCMQ